MRMIHLKRWEAASSPCNSEMSASSWVEWKSFSGIKETGGLLKNHQDSFEPMRSYNSIIPFPLIYNGNKWKSHFRNGREERKTEGRLLLCPYWIATVSPEMTSPSWLWMMLMFSAPESGSGWTLKDLQTGPLQHFFKDSLYKEPSRITRMHIHSFLDLCKIYLLSIHYVSGTRDTTISKIGTACAPMKLRVIHFTVYKNILAVPSILLYRWVPA